MKDLRNVLMTAVFLLLHFFAGAEKPAEFSIRQEGEKSFVLYIADPAHEKIWIRISDVHGYLLLDEKVKDTAAFARKYDLQHLPEGDYVLEIEDRTRIRSRNFSIVNNKLKLDSERQLVQYKPQLEYKGHYLDLNYLNLNAGTVHVTLLDANGVVVFKEENRGARTLHKRYDLQGINNGEYACLVKTNGKVYVHFFELKK